MDDFREIYENNESYVRHCLYWMLNRESIDDVVQEVFVKVWKSYSQFERKSNLKTWIYRIAVNCAYDHMRKEKKFISHDLPERTAAAGSPEETEILQRALKFAVSLLSPKQRAVFVLFYFQDLSVEEVAESAGISIGTVKSRLSSAREIISHELKRHGVEL
jgi:RNA polymerase sigma-70 factor, ECF subfamily